MLRPGGYAVVCDDGRVTERDTFTCRHCQRIMTVQLRQKPEDVGGFCRSCTGLICPNCVGGGCTPIEKRVEQEEARFAALRSYGLV